MCILQHHAIQSKPRTNCSNYLKSVWSYFPWSHFVGFKSLKFLNRIWSKCSVLQKLPQLAFSLVSRFWNTAYFNPTKQCNTHDLELKIIIVNLCQLEYIFCWVDVIKKSPENTSSSKKHLQVWIFDQFTYTSLTNLSYIKHEVLETICWQLFQGSELIIVKIIIQELAEGDIMMLKKKSIH